MSSYEYFMRSFHNNYRTSVSLNTFIPIIEVLREFQDIDNKKVLGKKFDEEKALNAFYNTWLNIYILNNALLSYLISFPEKIKDIALLENNFNLTELENFFRKNN